MSGLLEMQDSYFSSAPGSWPTGAAAERLHLSLGSRLGDFSDAHRHEAWPSRLRRVSVHRAEGHL
jgi:hypothetical protein